jgi:hypothetical protein
MAYSNGALNEQARRVGNPVRVVTGVGLSTLALEVRMGYYYIRIGSIWCGS